MELLEQFRARYSFPLDDFQLEAIRAIEAGQSVIVSAPTGAGKTLIAEFAIHTALATGKRIAYTTPLKALSNQKFNDFTRAFGAETVGILTGDVKVNAPGRVLVMTTEILRNALYGSGLHEITAVRAGRARLVGDESRGPDDRGRWYTRRVVDPGVLIPELETRGWLPAIYFIFSRAGCERALDDILAEGRGLLTVAQQDDVDYAINALIHESPTGAESTLNQTIFQALRLGVGLHHAGILPSLKRLIEQLFERGACRAVFATETMSLGIHMPARSVVLQGLTKRTDHGFRSLSHNGLTQMAGRAGRRGIDPEGRCVIALDARDGVEDLLRVVDGSPEPIESQFKLGYGSAALLLGTGAPPQALRRRIESSFGQYQNLRRIREMEAEVQTLEAALAEVKRYAAPCGDFQRIRRYRRARAEAEARRRALGRGGRRGERTVSEAEAGRLAAGPRARGPGLGPIPRLPPIPGPPGATDPPLPPAPAGAREDGGGN